MGLKRVWGNCDSDNSCSLEQQALNSSEQCCHGDKKRLGQQQQQLQRVFGNSNAFTTIGRKAVCLALARCPSPSCWLIDALQECQALNAQPPCHEPYA